MQKVVCSACGEMFECGALDASGTCWCAQLPHIIPFDEKATCLCPSCLKAKIELALANNSASKIKIDEKTSLL